MKPHLPPLLLAPLAAVGLFSSSLQAQEVVYQIDPVHTYVLARVKHLNVANSWGRFNDVSGEVRHNPADPSKSSVNFEIKAGSIDTANAKRDEHLRGPDFFNAKEFPLITFKSTKVRKDDDDDNEYIIEGDLTVRGVTKPVRTEFELVGTGKGLQGEERFGGELDFTVRRSDFGIDYLPDALGDEVKILVSVEGIKQ